MSKRHPHRPLRLAKAARILGIPIPVARQRQIPRIYEQLQQLLANPPSWLPEAQAQRRAIAASNRKRELARIAEREAAIASAQKAIVGALQDSPAFDTRSESFAFLALDGAVVSLLGRFNESTLEAAAWRLYPEAAERLFEPEPSDA